MLKRSEDCTFIRVANLSTEDSFMKHLPKTENERKLMLRLALIMQKGIKNFYRPKNENISSNGEYILNVWTKPLTEMTYNQWEEVAKNYDPSRNSRLGTKTEYTAFLGIVIKSLIINNWSIEDAWDAVCNNSKRLFEDKDTEKYLKEECGFGELITGPKILAVDDNEKNSNVAFYIAHTTSSLFDIVNVTYNVSEYDAVMDAYFTDYTHGSNDEYWAKMVSELSAEVVDVKSENRKGIGWVVF